MYPAIKIFIPILLFSLAIRMRTICRQNTRRYRRKPPTTQPPQPAWGLPQKKPDWVGREVLHLHECLDLSHRKLADAFNQLHLAATGMSVGRTWVRDLLKRQAYEALHRHEEWKHRVPPAVRINRTWGIDTTFVTDATGLRHIVLGIVDHGSRLNIALRRLRRFNAWTLLGVLLLAFGEYGMPDMIRLDNHPVHHAKRVKCVLCFVRIRLRFTQLASPWQNGRIERFFGTLKSSLQRHVICHAGQLKQSLEQFRFWYNEARCHQHLAGLTPMQAWTSIDPYRHIPLQVQRFEGWNGRLRGMVLRH